MGGKRVVASEWVTESTTAYSETPEGGYGYLWWVDGFDLPVKSFSARGALAKYIVVIPEGIWLWSIRIIPSIRISR